MCTRIIFCILAAWLREYRDGGDKARLQLIRLKTIFATRTYAVMNEKNIPIPLHIAATRMTLKALAKPRNLSYLSYMTGTASRNEARKNRISESKMASTDSAAVGGMNKCQAKHRTVRTRANVIFGLERGYASEAAPVRG